MLLSTRWQCYQRNVLSLVGADYGVHPFLKSQHDRTGENRDRLVAVYVKDEEGEAGSVGQGSLYDNRSLVVMALFSTFTVVVDTQSSTPDNIVWN